MCIQSVVLPVIYNLNLRSDVLNKIKTAQMSSGFFVAEQRKHLSRRKC